jgi:hypothetical protein
MVPSPAGHKARYPESYDRAGFLIPTIPCSACGRYLRFTECAIVNLPGGVGWGHRPGLCDQTDVAARQASLTRTY